MEFIEWLDDNEIRYMSDEREWYARGHSGPRMNFYLRDAGADAAIRIMWSFD